MHVLVTGAAGFVGRPLMAALLAAGWRVRMAVRRPMDPPEPGMEVAAVGDIGPDTDWAAALAGADVVIHLAARVHQGGRNDALAHQRINARGTRHLAEAAAAAGVRRFVFLSSTKVMGDVSPADRPWRETDAPRPTDSYGRSKLEAERALHEIASRTGMEVVILRPPLVYGPGVRANFRALMDAVVRGLPLPLGAVDNRRSLVFVGNLVDAILRCADDPRAAGQTFFVCDGEDVSTPALIRQVAVALGRPARLVRVPPALLVFGARLLGRGARATRLLGSLAIDGSHLRATLGWEPPYGLRDGLAQTARAYQAERRAAAGGQAAA
ncbi:MAG: NAD-dependent epimerase/dehydratase family protein [Betaproteobacteria bacterium]|nr:NAD-dependent epimerase/dehydratase family protein [Betaproteobacteria bacterium]